MNDNDRTQGAGRSQKLGSLGRRWTRGAEGGGGGWHVFIGLLAATVAVIGASVPLPAVATPTASASTPGTDWPGYLRDGAHSSYNAAATTISPANASMLGPAWRWLVPASPNAGRINLFASPTVSNGVVYIGAEDGYFYAISETTHQRIWSKFLGILAEIPGECGGGTAGIISTATVANDPTTGLPTVYIFGPDGYLYALDATTGSTVWRGLVDSPVPGSADYYSWSSPLVANGKVYVGISSNCGGPGVPGGITSFDQSTGNKVAHWTSVSPGQTGASVWSSPGLAADGAILVTTGNTCGPCIANPLYNESFVKLDPTTLQVQDAWQVPLASQGFDGDIGGSPTSFTAMLNGVATPMVSACDKGNGLFYALNENNLSAGPVWQAQMTIPYTANGANEQCDAAAIWNGSTLIEGGGAPTTINGITYTGSVQAFDPATGSPLWQTGLPGAVVGSPTEDGSGVIAAQVFRADTGIPGVYLLNAATGTILGFLAAAKSSPLFGQAVFVGNDLLVGGGPTMGLTDYHVVVPPSVTAATPSLLATDAAHAITLTGTGFTMGAKVTITNGSTTLAVKNVKTQPTSIAANVSAPAGAPTGPYSITVTNGDGGAATCTACLNVVPAPILTSISPPSIAPGTVTKVTLTGNNFATGLKLIAPTGVTFSKIQVQSTTITATMTVSPSTPAAANLPITVKNGLVGGFGSTTAQILVIGDPSAPVAVTAVPHNSSATVSFGPPPSDAGSAITNYTVTAMDVNTPGNGGESQSGASSPIVVTGLANGDSYTFTVTATNGAGTGPMSEPSNAVVPPP